MNRCVQHTGINPRYMRMVLFSHCRVVTLPGGEVTQPFFPVTTMIRHSVILIDYQHGPTRAFVIIFSRAVAECPGCGCRCQRGRKIKQAPRLPRPIHRPTPTPAPDPAPTIRCRLSTIRLAPPNQCLGLIVNGTALLSPVGTNDGEQLPSGWSVTWDEIGGALGGGIFLWCTTYVGLFERGNGGSVSTPAMSSINTPGVVQ